MDNEKKGTPSFKDGASNFFNKSLPHASRSPSSKLELEPKVNKGIPPKLKKDYNLKQKSARSSIDNIERKYSEIKENEFVAVSKQEANIEWNKIFDIK